MAIATDRFADRIGLFKIITIVLGIITCGFIGAGYFKDSRDEAFLSCVIICMILSVLWALIAVFDVIHQSDMVKKIDMVYHFVAYIFYLITLIVFIVSLIDHSSSGNKSKLGVRIFAFVFGILTTKAYGYTAYLMYNAL